GGSGTGARRAVATSSIDDRSDVDYWAEQNLTLLSCGPGELVKAVSVPARRRRHRSPERTAAPALRTPAVFKFLASYEEADAPTFFGREEDTATLIRRVMAAQMLILHSQSGAGKTSLIRAGVIPTLNSDGFRCAYATGWRD